MKLLIKGDKTIVQLNPVTVTICIAAPYYDYYLCSKCGKDIKRKDLYGRSRVGKVFCLACCEED